MCYLFLGELKHSGHGWPTTAGRGRAGPGSIGLASSSVGANQPIANRAAVGGHRANIGVVREEETSIVNGRRRSTVAG